MRTMLTRGIGHVAVATRDLGRLTAFYEDAFGATVERFGPTHAFIQIGPATVLHAFEREDGRPTAPGPWQHGPIDHFTLEAAGLDEFEVARRRLIERGAASEEVTDFGALVSVFFTDPDGLLLELSLWKPPDFDPPFDLAPFRSEAGDGADAPERPAA
jgi:catechol 2,3-dioxygenase-like lactoylglutathione lyase family enzyme